MIIIIHHSRDLDGWCSGAILKKKYPDAKLIGYDYGEPIPYDKIQYGDEVIMADVSFPMEDMFKIYQITKQNFTYIDHHISAIKDYAKYKAEKNNGVDFCVPVLDSTISACEGVWKYLYPSEQIPRAVLLLGEYDTWRKKENWDSEVMPFQFGLRSRCNSVETFPMFLLDGDNNEDIAQIISEGNVILKYQAVLNESLCKKAFECKFEGYSAICLNTPIANSDVFKSVYNENKHDLMMPFSYNGNTGKWTISCYTTKNIDCSVLMKKHGGGGHAKAAGCDVTDITKIFPIKKVKISKEEFAEEFEDRTRWSIRWIRKNFHLKFDKDREGEYYWQKDGKFCTPEEVDDLVNKAWAER